MKQADLIRQRIQHEVQEGRDVPSNHAAFTGGNRRSSDRHRGLRYAMYAIGAVVLFAAGAVLDDRVETIWNSIANTLHLPLHTS